MMQGLPSEVLEKWPRLKRLQTEIAELDRQHAEAQAKVAQLSAQLPAARDKDLDAAARAIRTGKKSPESTHEADIKAKLEGAERTRDAMQRALQGAQTDLGELIRANQVSLFEDVLQARKQIAQEIAEHAKAVLPAFGRWSDLFYTLKDLRPPVVHDTENAPAQRLTTTVIGVQTTQSAGPPRGQVEQILQHLISLAASGGEGASDAA